MKIAQPVWTGAESIETSASSGWVIYELGGALLGFIRQDAARVALADIIGPHVILRPLRIHGSQWTQCCRMPGVGYVDR